MTLKFSLFYEDTNTVKIRMRQVIPFFSAVTKDLLGSDTTTAFAKELLKVAGVTSVESKPYELVVIKSDVFKFSQVIPDVVEVVRTEIGEPDMLEFRPPAGDRAAILDGPKEIVDTTP